MNQNLESLIEKTIVAFENAFAPYSKFRVGASVVTKSGKIYTGCNIESASYGGTVCAERVSIWKAISEGEREFEILCVVADTERLTPPCGNCRQIIWEFCGDIPVVFANLQGKSEVSQMKALLPNAFDGSFFE